MQLPSPFHRSTARRKRWPAWSTRLGLGAVGFALWLGCPDVTAQNPFGGNEPAATTIQLKSSDPNRSNYDGSEDDIGLLIRSVAASNPKTPQQLARAVNNMMNVGQYEQAKSYLAQLVALNLDGAGAYDLYSKIGPDFFYSLSLSDAMQPAGRAWASPTLASAKSFSETPQRLEQLVKTLSQPDISVRSEAFNKLRRLGPVAAAAIINVFADESREEEFPYLRGALSSFGNAAIGPLLGAAHADQPSLAAESVAALTNFNSPAVDDVLATSWLSPKSSEAVRDAAARALIERGGLPDPAAVETRLTQRVDRLLAGRRETGDRLLDQIQIWEWDSESKSLVPRNFDPETAARIRAARGAADLYSLAPQSSRYRQLFLLTQIDSAKRMAGASDPIDMDQLLKNTGPLDPFEVESVLVRALEVQQLAAATGCCEILKSVGTTSQIIGGSRPSPLVQAVLTGERHLQFAAFDAITTIDPQTCFAGSSYIGELACYLARSHSQPAVLVGHIRSSVARTYAGTLETLGWEGIAATGSREFFKIATSNPDVSVLMVTDTLDKPAYYELIQQLRADWRTRQMPIALLVRDEAKLGQMQRILGNVDRLTTFPMATEPQFIAAQLVELTNRDDAPVVSADDRHHMATVATDWLVRVAQDPASYAHYRLNAHEDQIVQLLYIPEFSDQAATILAQFGTARAQRELVNYASQTGQPIETRQRVAKAFSDSVQGRGTVLLTTGEITQQYDRYNASESAPAATQEILGSLLDSIEAPRTADRSR